MADYVIYKYPLTDWKTELQLPARSRIFAAERVRGESVVYAIIDRSQKSYEQHVLYVIGTGQSGMIANPSSLFYIGTIKTENEASVVHVFEDCT